MAQTPETQLDKLMTWSFTLAEQGQVTRYGVLNGAFYKQFLPGGVEVPRLHPIRRIDKRLYDLALRQHQTRLQKS